MAVKIIEQCIGRDVSEFFRELDERDPEFARLSRKECERLQRQRASLKALHPAASRLRSSATIRD